jgi:osmotically-inducible protein OsmY
MSKKINTDAQDFNALKKLGFEFYPPQDGYSYQPDSGSTANGEIGKQEYGIDVDLDAQPYKNIHQIEDGNIEDSIIQVPQDELDMEDNSGDDDILFKLIQDRLNLNPNINYLDILVQVERGVVTLTGAVTNKGTKILVNDIVVALPGVNSLSNELMIR